LPEKSAGVKAVLPPPGPQSPNMDPTAASLAKRLTDLEEEVMKLKENMKKK
jgi:hypothetical protein